MAKAKTKTKAEGSEDKSFRILHTQVGHLQQGAVVSEAELKEQEIDVGRLLSLGAIEETSDAPTASAASPVPGFTKAPPAGGATAPPPAEEEVVEDGYDDMKKDDLVDLAEKRGDIEGYKSMDKPDLIAALREADAAGGTEE